MTFKTRAGGTRSGNFQQSFLDPWLEIEAYTAHIALNLAWRFLEREVQTALSASAGGAGKMRGEAGLAGSRSSRDQNAARTEKSFAAHHLIKAGDPGRNSFDACLMLESDGRNRNNGESGFVQQKRIFIGSVRGAAILYHPQAPG